MTWAKKYQSIKNQEKKTKITPKPNNQLFKQYQENLKSLFYTFSQLTQESSIQGKYQKILVPKNYKYDIKKEKIDAFILSDNDNELKLTPEGVHFIGVLGRVSIKVYKKIYSFNSLLERRIQTFKEPYFFLIHHKDSKKPAWGYILENTNSSLISQREIKTINPKLLEQFLDEVFLSQII